MRNLVFIIAAIGLATLAGRDAALAYWRSGPPGTPPAIFAGDAGVRLRLSDRLMSAPEELAAQAEQLDQAARLALRRSPLDVLAMRQLGVLAELREPGTGRAYIALAERISRRDLKAEILSIEHAASQDGAIASLRHFDHALAAFPLAKQQLYPFIASQLGEPGFARELAGYAERPWLRDFVVNAADYDVAPADLLALYDELGDRVSQAERQEGTVRLIRWLVSAGQEDALGTFARRLPGLPANAFAPIGFDAVTSNPAYAPLSWTLLNDAGIQTSTEGDALVVTVEPGISGYAASRVTLLAAGTYDFVQTISHDAGVPQAGLEWLVSCPDNPRFNLLQAARLTVPAQCTAQTWQLHASAAASQYAASGRISGIKLTGG